jgi:hypothetical protein
MSDNKGLGYVDARLDEVEAWDGVASLVNPGEYIVEIEKVEGGTAQSGKPKMVLHEKIVEALDEHNDDQTGRVLIQSQSLDLSNDTVRKRIKAIVTACGVAIDARGGFNAGDLVGRQMLVEVTRGSYTKTNAITGTPEERETASVVRERPVPPLEDEEPEAAPAPEEPKPATSARGRRRGSNAAAQPS